MRAACLLALVPVLASAADWIRIASPTIEVLTDAGEKNGRHALERFELLRQIFREANIAESPAPLRVFLFSAPKEFASSNLRKRGRLL